MPFDLSVFHALNQPGHGALDAVMRALSSRWFLLPVLAVAAAALWRLRSRRAALALLLVVGFADLVSVRVLKALTQRARPCQSLPRGQVDARYGCGTGTSFPSTHATNTAAAATVIAGALPPAGIAAAVIAIAVGVSRVYLGVHWPSDVLAGWLLGVLLGAIALAIVRRDSRVPR